MLSALLLVLACAPVLQSAGMLVGASLVALAALCFVAVPFGVWPWWQRAVRGARAPAAALLLYFSLILLFFAVYPALNANSLGLSSEADDMLNSAGAALLAGLYPFHYGTESGLPISQFPGAVVLASPLVALGNAALLPLLALPVFFLALRTPGANSSRALLVVVLGFALLPQLLGAMLSGDDLIGWTMLIYASSVLCLRWTTSWAPAAFGLAIGVLLSSYLWLALLVPVFLAALTRISTRRACICAAMLLLGFAALSLPWWLYDPDQFTPWLVQRGQFSYALWLAVLAIAIGAALLIKQARDFAWAGAWSFTVAELLVRGVACWSSGKLALPSLQVTSAALVLAIAAWAMHEASDVSIPENLTQP